MELDQDDSILSESPTYDEFKQVADEALTFAMMRRAIIKDNNQYFAPLSDADESKRRRIIKQIGTLRERMAWGHQGDYRTASQDICKALGEVSAELLKEGYYDHGAMLKVYRNLKGLVQDFYSDELAGQTSEDRWR